MFCVKYEEKCKGEGRKSFLLQFLFTKVDRFERGENLDSIFRVCLVEGHFDHFR